ncbi:hypothetical protein GCM10011335_42230 [Aureimonas glaciei]|uniref:Uncharacterized protein n=1 Tax=Aureimonas glaciei TaxID=1776957 RepID=A0A916Y8I5_9HYPH|nr:hypothetical protein GCM10011335_42230 [Aureimonas glaciei]
MDSKSECNVHRKMLRGLTRSEAATLYFLHSRQLSNSGGAGVCDLDENQRARIKVLLVRGLAEFVLALDGTRRCIPTKTGRAIIACMAPQ